MLFTLRPSTPPPALHVQHPRPLAAKGIASAPKRVCIGGRALPFLARFARGNVGGCVCIKDAADKIQAATSADLLRPQLFLVSRDLGAGRQGACPAELGVVAAAEMRWLRRANKVDEAALQSAAAVFALLGGIPAGEEPHDERTLDELLALCRAEFAASAPHPACVRRWLASEWPPVALHPMPPHGEALPASGPAGFSEAFRLPDGVECGLCGMTIPPARHHVLCLQCARHWPTLPHGPTGGCDAWHVRRHGGVRDRGVRRGGVGRGQRSERELVPRCRKAQPSFWRGEKQGV